jgi:hypothetical protein
MNVKRTTLTLAVLAATTLFAVSIRAQEGKKADLKTAKDGIVAGYRGFALTLPGTQLAFVNKGDRVDVLVTFDAQMKDNVKEKVTATILQNVLIVGVRAPAKLDENGVVELEVNPNEGQYAALALQEGAVHLLMRAEGDKEMKPMEMASFRKLFR